MRIANNIMAMNTHRSYTTNNDKIAASAEKLSSGYRINKAGDDAAGLAISEKMRAQIRGLNMATRNSQDAISLIQTAEGALQEVHSMLQRMNELAVQSATGTNETFDRTQIAKEFEQLKREINDISEQTTFNNMNILDGSLSAQGLQRSAYTSGIYTQFEEIDPTTGAGGVKDITLTEGTPYVKGYSSTFTIELAGLKITDAVTTGSDVELTISGATIATTSTGLTSASTAADIAAALVADNAANTFNFGGYEYTVSNDGSKLIFTFDETQTGQEAFADIDTDTLNGFKLTSVTLDGGYANINKPVNTNVVSSRAGKADVNATIAQASFRFDWETAKSGDTFTIGSDIFTFFNSDNGEAAPPLGLDLASITSASDLAAELNKFITAGGSDTVRDTQIQANAIAAGDRVIITFDGTLGSMETANTGNGPYGTKGNEYVKISSQPLNPDREGKTTFELDTDKMKIGDVISWKADDGTIYEYTVHSETTVKEIAAQFGIATVDGNTWVVEGTTNQSDRIGFRAAPDYTEYDMMKIQIGALEGEQLSIKIAAMNTAGLALDDADIYTQASAGNAITLTRAAINEVSDQRARLGAMQNRMDHKINNLKISAENLQAAESRIRDVDIASEMTKFTQANILSQAATAMLAQANAAPQNVLSLLK